MPPAAAGSTARAGCRGSHLREDIEAAVLPLRRAARAALLPPDIPQEGGGEERRGAPLGCSRSHGRRCTSGPAAARAGAPPLRLHPHPRKGRRHSGGRGDRARRQHGRHRAAASGERGHRRGRPAAPVLREAGGRAAVRAKRHRRRRADAVPLLVWNSSGHLLPTKVGKPSLDLRSVSRPSPSAARRLGAWSRPSARQSSRSSRCLTPPVPPSPSVVPYPRQATTAAARFDARGSPIRNDHRFVT